MILMRCKPLNPFTPDPDFGNLFCVFWQAIGKLQFLVSMFPAIHSEFERARLFLPASYCGVALCMILCFGKVLKKSSYSLNLTFAAHLTRQLPHLGS